MAPLRLGWSLSREQVHERLPGQIRSPAPCRTCRARPGSPLMTMPSCTSAIASVAPFIRLRSSCLYCVADDSTPSSAAWSRRERSSRSTTACRRPRWASETTSRAPAAMASAIMRSVTCWRTISTGIGGLRRKMVPESPVRSRSGSSAKIMTSSGGCSAMASSSVAGSCDTDAMHRMPGLAEHGIDGGKIVVKLADDDERHTHCVAQIPHPRPNHRPLPRPGQRGLTGQGFCSLGERDYVTRVWLCDLRSIMSGSLFPKALEWRPPRRGQTVRTAHQRGRTGRHPQASPAIIPERHGQLQHQ